MKPSNCSPMNTKRFQHSHAFTLVEMLTVITVILILAAILLNVAGYVNNKAARSRAAGEIHVLSVACENYKADIGTYPWPVVSGTTSKWADHTDGNVIYDESAFQAALYQQ